MDHMLEAEHWPTEQSRKDISGKKWKLMEKSMLGDATNASALPQLFDNLPKNSIRWKAHGCLLSGALIWLGH